jgi:hypothetical protein
MIKPTVGRIVLVWRMQTEDDSQPEAARIVFVNSDTSINVVGESKSGMRFFLPDLHLRQEAHEQLPWPFADWMPYQKGQAAKTEALEKLVGSVG